MPADHASREVVVTCLMMVADTLSAEIVSCNGGMWTELEAVKNAYVPSGEGVLPVRKWTRLTSLGVPESTGNNTFERASDCTLAGCSAGLNVHYIEDTYIRVQHGENPEHSRFFVATTLYFETGHIWCSDSRRGEQLRSWLQEIHEHELSWMSPRERALAKAEAALIMTIMADAT